MSTEKDKLKRALVAIRTLKSKLKTAQSGTSIAIVGAGCRFPGGANDLDSYWKLIKEGRDVIGEIPKDRWNKDEWFSTDRDATGKMYSKWGGFLPNIEYFDPKFFGISPREAAYIDPQQRMFLEISWEALERAGYSKSDLMNSNTGVYMGVYTNDYQRLVLKNAGEIGTH